MQKGSDNSHFGFKLSRVAQASMSHGRNGSEIEIAFVQLGTSLTHRSNPNLSWNDLLIIQEFSMMTVMAPIAVRWSKNKSDSESGLVDIFIGLILNDWMTKSVLDIVGPDPVVEEVRNMQFSFDALTCFIPPKYYSLKWYLSVSSIPGETEIRGLTEAGSLSTSVTCSRYQ